MIAPTRSNGCPSSTRRNLACVDGLISPISSSISVPRSAPRTCRSCVRWPGEGAPFVTEQFTLSSVSDNAAQFRQTNGPFSAAGEVDGPRDQLLATRFRRGPGPWPARRRLAIACCSFCISGPVPMISLAAPNRSRNCTISFCVCERFSANSCWRLRFFKARPRCPPPPA